MEGLYLIRSIVAIVTEAMETNPGRRLVALPVGLAVVQDSKTARTLMPTTHKQKPCRLFSILILCMATFFFTITFLCNQNVTGRRKAKLCSIPSPNNRSFSFNDQTGQERRSNAKFIILSVLPLIPGINHSTKERGNISSEYNLHCIYLIGRGFNLMVREACWHARQ
jgi:hypothetical protein